MNYFRSFAFSILFVCLAGAQDGTYPLEQLITSARAGATAPGLKEAITKTLSARGGTAVWGQDFLFVTESPEPVSVSINEQPPQAMARIEGSNFQMRLEKMRTGVTHSY